MMPNGSSSIKLAGFAGAGLFWLKSPKSSSFSCVWPKSCLTSAVKSPNSSSGMVSNDALPSAVGLISECMSAGIVFRRTGVGDSACVGIRGLKLNWSWVGDLTMVAGSSVRSNRSMLGAGGGWKDVGRGFAVCDCIIGEEGANGPLLDVNATELDRLMEDKPASCCFKVDTFRWLIVVLCCRGKLLEAVMGDVGAVLVVAVVGDFGKLDFDKWGKNLDSDDRPNTDDLFSGVVGVFAY